MALNCTVFALGAWNRQIDGQTDDGRRITASLNAPTVDGEGNTTVAK